jgi:ADP-ribose pyrophosphatase YjhB (NUDIX family)
VRTNVLFAFIGPRKFKFKKLEYLTEELILSRIEELKFQGFDQIRIPGGSSKDESHYSGVFVFKYDKDFKQMFFLGVPYNSIFWKENGSNGHTKKQDETYLQTACREVFEETGYHTEESDLILVFNYFIPDRKDNRKNHTKNFYVCDTFTGNLHNFEGANLIDKETAAPIWIPVKLFKKVLYYGHQKALIKVIENLSGISADYYYALCNL